VNHKLQLLRADFKTELFFRLFFFRLTLYRNLLFNKLPKLQLLLSTLTLQYTKN